jgi:hypothetical protein
MTIEQLEKRRDSCEKQISLAEKEKEKVEKQIDELVLRETKPVLAKVRLSITDFLNLKKASDEELNIIYKILKKEEKRTGDVQKEKRNEAAQQ